MATTKRRSTKSPTSSRKRDASLPARTGRTIKNQPYVTAAIATGAGSAVPAALAGAFFSGRSGKGVGELTGDLSDKAREGLSEAKAMAAEGARSVKEKAAFLFGEEGDDRTQAEIAEEALTLKQTGEIPARPFDETASDQIKSGSIAY